MKYTRQERSKIMKEIKDDVKPMIEQAVRKHDPELTYRHIEHFVNGLLQPISRHFGGID